MTLAEKITAARRAGTPLVVIRTADPASTIKRITDSIPANSETPMIRWDVVRGALGVDEASAAILQTALREASTDGKFTTNPGKFLVFSRSLPANSIIFMLNLHRFCSEDIGVIQALWNLRDEFKTSTKCVIGLVPHITLPAELSQDVLVLDEPLPTDVELKAIAADIFNAAQIDQPSAGELERIVDATLGLAAFPAEQSMAMSITRRGMDIDELWSRKQSVVEQTPGLSIWRGHETFSDIGGCQNVKDFLTNVITGNEAPRAVVFIDEIEKSIGTGQDSSGVSQGMLGALLTWMQDNAATGCIFIGPPGAAKSALAKATGNEAGIPTISLDMGSMKNSLVGESEARFRRALKVVDAVSQKRSLFIATCNSIGILPPELRRRFTFGTFYFELPDADERAAIWGIYRAKYNIAESDAGVKHDEGWTGAEIKQCCELSFRLRKPLNLCASYIVPVAISASEQIKKLREQADGKFISASHPGIYRMQADKAPPVNAGRSISFN